MIEQNDEAVKQMNNSEILYEIFVRESRNFSGPEVCGASVIFMAAILSDISNNMPFIYSEEEGVVKEIETIDGVIDLFFKNVSLQLKSFKSTEALH